jgi:hypothetical protein
MTGRQFVHVSRRVVESWSRGSVVAGVRVLQPHDPHTGRGEKSQGTDSGRMQFVDQSRC